MTRTRVTRALGALTTLAVIALTFQFVGSGAGGFGGLSAGASTVSMGGCQGTQGDAAGAIGGAPKDSAGILGLLGTVSSSPLTIPIVVTADAPAKVSAGSKPFTVTFNAAVQIDATLSNLVKQYVGKSTIDLVNTSFVIQADGTGQQFTGTIPNQTINVDQGSPTFSFQATVNPTSQGRIRYRLLTLNIGVQINGDVLGGAAHIGTLSLACSSVGDNIAGSTVVSVPGAPDVADIRFAGHWGINLWHLQDGQLIQPDDNNPIIPESMQITNPIPMSHGLVATQSGWLGMLVGYQGYNDDIGMNVCAPARPVPAEPGANETFQLAYGDLYQNRPLNALLLGFNLHVGSTDVTIRTGKQKNWQGAISNAPLSGGSFLDLVGTQPTIANQMTYFERPAAAVIQKAIESVVGAGNVTVTDGPAPAATAVIPYKPYEINYTGALAEKDGPDISIGRVWTTFDPDGKQKSNALAQATKLAGDPSKPKPPPLTIDKLGQQLLTGVVDLAGFVAGIGTIALNNLEAGIDPGAATAALTGLFPSGPVLTKLGSSRATIPATTTGPLCTPFSVSVVTPAVPLNIVLFFTALANGSLNKPAAGKVCTARVKVTTKVRSHGRTRTVTRYVNKVVACKK